ncbi:hypothetical protein ACIA8O_21695 [Kitasatospora sp. NPDC051853]|uniref:hypothetical protein n=1 Tax=Kitasatospora sp. NPDC051853 TaxID=3364058 RepID=UPI0037BD8CD5
MLKRLALTVLVAAAAALPVQLLAAGAGPAPAVVASASPVTWDPTLFTGGTTGDHAKLDGGDTSWGG